MVGTREKVIGEFERDLKKFEKKMTRRVITINTILGIGIVIILPYIVNILIEFI